MVVYLTYYVIYDIKCQHIMSIHNMNNCKYMIRIDLQYSIIGMVIATIYILGELYNNITTEIVE